MDKVVHFEIPFDDEKRAKEFYSHVFGWKLIEHKDMNYVVAHTAETEENGMIKELGSINGGLFKREDDSVQTPVIVIDVESIDETIRHLEHHNGSVFKEKHKVGDMGWYAQIEDSEGNIIGIWETIPK